MKYRRVLTEKEIEKEILDALMKHEDVFAFKVNTTGVFDPKRKIYRTIKNRHIHKGTSDILGVWKGAFFAIEVKKPSTIKKAIENTLSPQSRFLSSVEEAGGIGRYMCSADEVDAFLEVIKSSRRWLLG